MRSIVQDKSTMKTFVVGCATRPTGLLWDLVHIWDASATAYSRRVRTTDLRKPAQTVHDGLNVDTYVGPPHMRQTLAALGA
jgi:hypothetical protein